MTAGYIQHSKTLSEAKDKGSFAAEYLLSQADQIHSPYLPKSIFLEQERILYPHFYFYFGKTDKGNRYTVDAGSFDKLNKIEEFFVSSPMSTLPNKTENTTAKPLYFFYDSAYHELTFLLHHKNQNQAIDTIIYKKQL